jgi:hypothetical protein
LHHCNTRRSLELPCYADVGDLLRHAPRVLAPYLHPTKPIFTHVFSVQLSSAYGYGMKPPFYGAIQTNDAIQPNAQIFTLAGSIYKEHSIRSLQRSDLNSQETPISITVSFIQLLQMPSASYFPAARILAALEG